MSRTYKKHAWTGWCSKDNSKPWRHWTIPSWFARTLRRDYRSKCKQLMREKKYDLIPRPRRNKIWLWW